MPARYIFLFSFWLKFSSAEYAGGEVTPDGEEIGEAGWFGRDNLPPIPSPFSIARRLIDTFFDRR
jgi:NAD+ diphosphatase